MADQNEMRVPRRWRRWYKRVALAFALLVVALIGAWYAVRSGYAYFADRELHEYYAELDATDPGWRFEEIQAARVVIPKAENSAPVVVAARLALPEQWPELATRVVVPEPAENPSLWLKERLTTLPPNEQLDDELAGQLDYELTRADGALSKGRQLAELPRGRHATVYTSDFISTQLVDVQATRDVTRLLCLDAAAHAQKQAMDKALDSCRAAINAGRSIGDEPSLVAMLARVACVRQATESLERVLAQGLACEAGLVRVQALLADEESQDLALAAARGDRAGFHRLFTELEGGRVSLEHATGGPTPRELSATIFLAGPGFYKRNHRRILIWFTEIIDILADGADDHEEPFENFRIRLVRDRFKPPYDKTLAALLLPAVQKVAAAQQLHRAHLRSAVVAVAAERFRLRRDEWPESLEALVTAGLLPKVPVDPFDGNPLRLSRTNEGLVIYSIGPDRNDNGGMISRQRPAPPNSDVGLQLWNQSQRRKPALPP